MTLYLIIAGLTLYTIGALSGFVVASLLGAGRDEGSDLFPTVDVDAVTPLIHNQTPPPKGHHTP